MSLLDKIPTPEWNIRKYAYAYTTAFLITYFFHFPTARAQILDICNQGTVSAYVAGAYYQQLTNSAIVVGWVEVKPGDCVRVTRHLIPSGWSVGRLQRFYYGIMIQNGKGEWGMYNAQPLNNRNSRLRPTDQVFCVNPKKNFRKNGKMSALVNCSSEEQLGKFSGYFDGKNETIITYEFAIYPTRSSKIIPFENTTTSGENSSNSANSENPSERLLFERAVPKIVNRLIQESPTGFASIKGQPSANSPNWPSRQGHESRVELPDLETFVHEAKIWDSGDGNVAHEITYIYDKDIGAFGLSYFHRIKDIIDKSIPEHWKREEASNQKEIFYKWCDTEKHNRSFWLYSDRKRTFKFITLHTDNATPCN
ncbi:hypothetical protein [uncultured Pontibacter sp.]|uniref:hypothetical protein n=1 Tax=uncultured Pontibacter sp. TaxID=453356 RepID=UPI0026151256|nr:hypothetical protein [uncultured Pontibacter sp.]